MKLLLLSAAFLLFLSSSAFALDGDWWGNVTIIDTSGNVNITTNGAVVSAMVNGRYSSAYDVIGTPDSNFYLIHVNGSTGDNVSFQVFGINASPTNSSPQSWSSGDHARLNLLAHIVPTGGVCAIYPSQVGNIHGGCQEGFCVHNTCRAAATYCGDGFCDSGESCSADGCDSDDGGSGDGGGGGGGGGSGGAPPSTDTAPPAPGTVISVSIPITDVASVTTLISSIPPSVLGVTSLDAADVVVTQTGIASLSTTTDTTSTLAVISSTLSGASGEAQDALEQLQSTLSGGSASPIKVQKKLEVFNVLSRTSGQVTTISRITLTFTPTAVGQEVTLVEVIPKSVAQSSTQVHFIGTQPKVLQVDPIVAWSFVSSSTIEQSFSYVVDKGLTAITSTTVSVASTPAETRSCQPGALLCVSSELLGTCRADGSGYDTSSCPYGCQDGACLSPSLPPAVPVTPQSGGGIIIAVTIIAMVLAALHIRNVRNKKNKRRSVRYAFGKK